MILVANVFATLSTGRREIINVINVSDYFVQIDPYMVCDLVVLGSILSI